MPFFAKLPACLIGIEACATAHYWARELGALGHLVKLIPPSYMKPNVKRQKNDAADAEAICEAVTRPMMLFVEVKSPEQQSVMVLHKVRLTLMFQRIQLSNTIRGHIAEFGLVAPIGRAGLQQLIKPEESDPCVPDEEGCAWSRRSMQGFGTSCSTAKSSTPSPGRRSSSKLAAPLQYGAPAWLARIQAAGSGGLRPRHGRAGGCATRTSYADRASLQANRPLTIAMDQPAKADHWSYRSPRRR